MNKLKALFVFLLFAACAKVSIAQTSVNIIKVTPGNENTSPNFIDDISFTPNGILQNTVSGGSRSIKVSEVPVVTKVNETKAAGDESSSTIENLSAIQYKYAMMLDVDMESLENLSLFSFIENWLGTRYRMGGTTKKGIDCSAFTSTLLMAVYGFAVPRTAREQYKATKHINKEDLQEGDLVFFNTHGGVSHVGLYLDNNYFVQSSSSQGVTISSLEDGYYARKFICGGRVVQ